MGGEGAREAFIIWHLTSLAQRREDDILVYQQTEVGVAERILFNLGGSHAAIIFSLWCVHLAPFSTAASIASNDPR